MTNAQAAGWWTVIALLALITSLVWMGALKEPVIERDAEPSAAPRDGTTVDPKLPYAPLVTPGVYTFMHHGHTYRVTTVEVR